jgi:DNA repair protein RecO (recombination protein O)
LLLASFFWRLISIEGATPQLDVCVNCNEQGNLSYFDVQQGGVHCGACRSGVPISESAIEILRWILGGRMNEALALDESIPVHEVNRLAMEAMESHLERRLKSLGVFDRHL